MKTWILGHLTLQTSELPKDEKWLNLQGGGWGENAVASGGGEGESVTVGVPTRLSLFLFK